MEQNKELKAEEFKPYVPADSNAPEFTITSVIMGIILAVVFGAANAYLGLRVGMTVSASIPAAVISMGVIRMIMRVDDHFQVPAVCVQMLLGFFGGILVKAAVYKAEIVPFQTDKTYFGRAVDIIAMLCNFDQLVHVVPSGRSGSVRSFECCPGLNEK